MRSYFSFLLLIFSLHSAAQWPAEKNCRTNVMLDVAIDTITRTNNSVRGDSSTDRPGFIICYAGSAFPGYILRPLNDNYEVVSFLLITEAGDYIIEVPVQGNAITTKARLALSQTSAGGTTWFECIRARHTNGNTYVLKSFSIVRP